MAIKLKEQLDFISVISRIDDCVNCDDEQYGKYLETLDEDLLMLDESEDKAVRFILKTQLRYEATRKIKRDQVSVSKEGGMAFNLGYTMTILRHSLTGIENATTPLLEFRIVKSDGLAAEDLVNRLESLGIAGDLIQARENYMKPNQGQDKKN